MSRPRFLAKLCSAAASVVAAGGAVVALVAWSRCHREPSVPSPVPLTAAPRANQDPSCPTAPDRTRVALEGVGACLELAVDARMGRVTAEVVDSRDGRPVPLRADLLTLYAPFEPGSRGATEAARVWLQPSDPAPDSQAVPHATRFEGESPAFRGSGPRDAMLALILVRGVPFRGVEFRLSPSAVDPRADTSHLREPGLAD